MLADQEGWRLKDVKDVVATRAEESLPIDTKAAGARIWNMKLTNKFFTAVFGSLSPRKLELVTWDKTHLSHVDLKIY